MKLDLVEIEIASFEYNLYLFSSLRLCVFAVSLQRMRVIVLLNSLYTGGAEYSTLTFYQWLQKNGHDVKLVCVKKASPSYDPRDFDFHDVHYLKGNTFYTRLKDFKTVIKSFSPQLVHSVLFDANMIGRLSRVTKGKFIHLESLVNEMYSDKRYADPQVTRIKLFGYRMLDFVTQLFGVDHYHANGKSVAEHYKRKLGINPVRITIIPRGRNANVFYDNSSNRDNVRNELGTGNRLLLISVARHEYQKGQDILLDALHHLKKEYDKIQLVLVGREGKLSKLISEKIKAYELESIVLRTGHRDDTNSLLAASDIFVFPSRFEGLPGALIEAEAAGLPIICSDISNNREVVEESVNAFLYPVDESKQLAEKIAVMMHDDDLRKKMGRESLRIFKQRYTLEEINMNMLALLENLIRV